jgi:hypothetical protein
MLDLERGPVKVRRQLPPSIDRLREREDLKEGAHPEPSGAIHTLTG